jgi:hypothetical protein
VLQIASTILFLIYLFYRAGPDLETCIGSEIQLNATGGIAYVWTDNDDLSELDIADPIAHVFADSYYVVAITDFMDVSKLTQFKLLYYLLAIAM